MLAAAGRRMLSRARGRGFTLIEVLLAMSIFGLVMAAALPNFSKWIANSRVRTTAESIQNGLMLAKAEAVRRNAKVQLVLTSTTPTVANVGTVTASTTGTGWLIRQYHASGTYTSADFVQGRSIAEGGSNTAVTAGQSAFIFTGTARLSPLPASAVSIDISATGSTRALRITVEPGSAIRMCDPALSIATTTMGC